MEEYVLGNSCHMMNLGMNMWPGGNGTSLSSAPVLTVDVLCGVEHNNFFLVEFPFRDRQLEMFYPWLVRWKPSLTTESTMKNYHSGKLLFDSLNIFGVLK